MSTVKHQHLSTFEEDVFATFDRNWLTLNQVTAQTRVRKSWTSNEMVGQHSIPAATFEAALARLVRAGYLETQIQDDEQSWRRRL